METLRYFDESHVARTVEVESEGWSPAAEPWFRERTLRRDGAPFAVQKTVLAGSEQLHEIPYAGLEQEARVGLRLAQRYRFAYPETIPRVLGHDVDGAFPFVLYAPVAGIRMTRSAGELGAKDAYAFVVALFNCLHLLSSAGVVHDGLNPAGVLTDNGTVRLADLSTATFAGTPRRSAGVTGYAAPDQIVGAPAHPGDDVWSAAAVTYWAIIGQTPQPALSALATRSPELHRLFNDLFAPVAANRPAAAAVVTRFRGTPVPTGPADDAWLEPGRAAYDQLMVQKHGRKAVAAPAAPEPRRPAGGKWFTGRRA